MFGASAGNSIALAVGEPLVKAVVRAPALGAALYVGIRPADF